MPQSVREPKLENGTLIRHKQAGYSGRIDGTTEIKECFTSGGQAGGKNSSGYNFQYRVAVDGETMRRIAPAEDLEVLDGVVAVQCSHCQRTFHSKPGATGKPGGRCQQCGQWICPSCLCCQAANGGAEPSVRPACSQQRKRIARRLAADRKRHGI